MGIGRELYAQVRALDEYDLRRLLIYVKGVLIQRGALPAEETGRPGRNGSKVGYRQQSVHCGKPGCRRCPHGPYWYAYWREEGRLRSRYIGKNRPEDAAPSAEG